MNNNEFACSDDGSAELVHSWKLEVKGNCTASLLPKNKTYTAYFMVLLRKDSVFTTPSYLQITLPSEKPQVKCIELKDSPKEKTIRLQLGEEFNTSSLKDGDIEFSLYGNDQAGKKGLVVYGVLFAPVED